MLAAIRLAIVVYVNALNMLLNMPIALTSDDFSERRFNDVTH